MLRAIALEQFQPCDFVGEVEAPHRGTTFQSPGCVRVCNPTSPAPSLPLHSSCPCSPDLGTATGHPREGNPRNCTSARGHRGLAVELNASECSMPASPRHHMGGLQDGQSHRPLCQSCVSIRQLFHHAPHREAQRSGSSVGGESPLSSSLTSTGEVLCQRSAHTSSNRGHDNCWHTMVPQQPPSLWDSSPPALHPVCRASARVNSLWVSPLCKHNSSDHP